MRVTYDILIVGSGVIGCATALAIAQQTSLKVGVVDSKINKYEWNENNSYEPRVSAISHASKNILSHLGAWDDIEKKRVSAYTKMKAWDSEGTGSIFFDSSQVNENNLGYIIENNVISSSLLDKFSYYSNISYFRPVKLTQLEEFDDKIVLTCEDNTLIDAKLVIAADGFDSWVRKASNIEIKTHDYQHTALVATVNTSLSHQNTARQRFLPSGPLAFLPLKNNFLSSIVWSASHDYARDLMMLSDDDFKDELAKQFDYALGDIIDVSKRFSFPLRMRHAKNYVKNRIALVGDALHTIHPLVGQGVNLGLLDAASLAEVIIDAYTKNRDFSSISTLRRYERWRKTDTLAMLSMVDLLKRLFENKNAGVAYARNVGLNFTNQIPWIKHFIAHYALGKRGDLPLMANKQEELCF
ncbi:UbiH/UbiF/VisC/COQ6 family ubiquinone biosynthesis hydroxylase [Gammaproteobacteria bacterium]|nr:UbiH/UbiF/VisC/COQ6 family ubiquinone biosynthesis hydroxylase [Gammaproteobacteria bacterium]